MTSRQLPWIRLFAEGVVIVASVLLALGADAWRQGQVDRASETVYLESLLRDLRTDSLEYESVAAMLELAAYSTERTLTLVHTGSTAVEDPAVLFIYCASYLPLPVITQGTLDDLLSTGSLQLLRNRDLRASLLSYYSTAEARLQFTDEYRASQQLYRDVLAELQVPERYPELMGTSARRAEIGNMDGTQLVHDLSNMARSVPALNRMLFAQRRMLSGLRQLSDDVSGLIGQVRSEPDRAVGAADDALYTRAPSAELEASTQALCPPPPTPGASRAR